MTTDPESTDAQAGEAGEDTERETEPAQTPVTDSQAVAAGTDEASEVAASEKEN